MSPGEDGGTRRTSSVVALAVLGGSVTGVVALLVGFLAIRPSWGGPLAAGVCFLAAGVSFGLLANALFRR